MLENQEYCDDCHKRLSLAKAKTLAPEKNAFQYGGIVGIPQNIPHNNIREIVLDQIVIDDLKRLSAFAREEPDKFYEAAMQKEKIEAKKFYVAASTQKSKA